MEARLVSSSQVSMTEMVLPSHTNSLNSVFGGVIMSWIDIAAAICAQRHSSRPCVTASIDALDFIAPAYVGWVIGLNASVNYVSRTSMEIGVVVNGENTVTGENKRLATAYLTFVALDEKGKPTPVPPLKLVTEDEQRRFEEAEIRQKARVELRKDIREHRQSD